MKIVQTIIFLVLFFNPFLFANESEINFVSQFMENDKIDIFIKAEKIMDGYNPNEVMLVDKTLKKQGFFEKFFNFFN